MADRAISQLTKAAEVYDNDLLVLEQNGEAKKLEGSSLKQYIVGVGGIDSITMNADYTLTINYTNGTSYTTPSIRGAKGDTGEKGDTGDLISRIVRTSGTGAAGTTDTYTVYNQRNQAVSTFQVYNGADGHGVGDMLKSVYDSHGKNRDIFDYADTKYSKPSGGIPKTDMASSVQTSLGKADNAMQKNTAITDIQYVTALPANPNATTLYLIAES